MQRWSAVFCLVAALAAPQRGGRLRPPEKIPCVREKLTSFTGKVQSYSRDEAHLALTVRTDEDTTEKLTLRYEKKDDPARWFLLWSEAFQPSDWAAIEAARGRLRAGMRATAWVCEGGGNPIIDWQPPRD